MTGVEAPFALPWMVLAAVWVCLAPLAFALERLARPWLARIEPAQRAALVLALGLLPMIGAGLVAVLAFAPRIGGLLVDHHCHADVGCTAHIPILHTTIAHAELLDAALVILTGAALWTIASRLRRSLVLASMLSSLAERSARETFKVVESDARFAYCVGLLKPQVLVSRGVLDLAAPQRDAVIAHERAHAARYDNLRRWLAGVSLWPLPKRARGVLLAALAEAAEEACDRAAVAAHGERPLADALAVLAAPPRAPARSVALGGSQVAVRLRALAAPRHVSLPSSVLATLVLALYTPSVMLALDAAHHGSELVLAWLD